MKAYLLCLALLFSTLAQAQFIPVPKPGQTTPKPPTPTTPTPTKPDSKPGPDKPTKPGKPDPKPTETKPDPKPDPKPEHKPDPKPSGETTVMWFRRGAICVAKDHYKFEPSFGMDVPKCSELVPAHPDAIFIGVSPNDCMMMANFENASLVTIDLKDCTGRAVD